MADVVLVDPQGRQVELADATWDRHIVVGHPDFANERRGVESATMMPVLVCESVAYSGGIEYYARSSQPGLYIMVATRESSDDAGTRRIVKTAHYVRQLGRGRQPWP